jgi:predicted metal-dependent hydrolase
MGYTSRTMLWRVELPLALPVIMAGVRIATVTTIGLVTVTALIGQGGLGTMLADRYSQSHVVRNDGQLYDYVQALKDRHLRKSVPLGKVVYDSKLQVMKHALGTHTAISRVQGGRLRASREIRIAAVFRDAPAEFLKMIVVHELAHQKEAEHNKSFYQLCMHMAPDYHQLEFDLRLYLTHLDAGRREPGR